ncbi:MAG: hypothetical protein HYV60_02265 [Planctomycetia bacterium]|nr:hypothetical protein [Planctomycetia bacterium]
MMQDQDSWSNCPSGVLTDMAGKLRRRRHQSQLRPFIAAGLALLLVAAVGYGLSELSQVP